jgi:hypothetical protein
VTRWGTTMLPADLGVRAATRFYLRRLAILGTLVLLAALVPALVVLLHHGPTTLAMVLVALVLLGAFAFDFFRGKPVEEVAASLDLRRRETEHWLPARGRGWLGWLRLVPGVRIVFQAIRLLTRMLNR